MTKTLCDPWSKMWIRSDARAQEQGCGHEINSLVPMCGGKQTPHCKDRKHLVAAECHCRVISTHFHKCSGRIHIASYCFWWKYIAVLENIFFHSTTNFSPSFSHYVLSYYCTKVFSFFIVYTSPNFYLLVQPLSPSPHTLDWTPKLFAALALWSEIIQIWGLQWRKRSLKSWGKNRN